MLTEAKTPKFTELPAKIGRFVPAGILGKGAQGIVYLAKDTELERQVAIKTLNKRQRDSEQLIREARNVSTLEHPHIIPIYEIGLDEDMPYLVYQYCEGIQLKEKLRQEHKLKTLDAIRITCQILEGIDYAHRNGIIHCDLNPSNIMIGKDNHTKIMDFGISIIAGSVKSTGDIDGTINYMAPEQLN
ncbi:MAG: serine/threonine-protein kinase, partial [Gammaproteobacteria bacterium]